MYIFYRHRCLERNEWTKRCSREALAKARVSRDTVRPRGVEEELLRDAEGRSDAKDGGALFTPGVEANEGIIIIGRRDCETAVQERVEFTQELATIRR